MKVLKFGGTSLGSPELIKKVENIVKSTQACTSGTIVVFSAFSGITNLLIEAGKTAEKGNTCYLEIVQKIKNIHTEYITYLFPDETAQNKTFTTVNLLLNELDEITHGMLLLKELSPKSLDLLQSFGERLSCTIISNYLNYCGIKNTFLDTRKIIITDEKYNNAHINFTITSKNIIDSIKQPDALYIATGFIASSEKGTTTTIGRSGSDLTAAIFGTALSANSVEIWTDVSGVMSADPHKVKTAFSLKSISYVEAMEMSHFGAKVIHPLTVQPLMENNIPCYIKNTFEPEFPGTLIVKKSNEKSLAKAVTSIDDIALISLQGSGMIGIEGTASRMFGALARNSINVILITQASSEHAICAAIKPECAELAKECLSTEFHVEISGGFIEPVKIEMGLSIIAIVGEQMQHTPGISGKLFNALAEKKVNVIAIAQGSSELNISLVISKSDETMALNAVHESFFALQSRLFLFIAGAGLISRELLKQISDNAQRLIKDKNLGLIVAGLANSKKMLLNIDGISLNNYKKALTNSKIDSDISKFLDFIHSEKLTHCIFVDCTANEHISQKYSEFLEAGVSVVAANKKANTRKYNEYIKLQNLAIKNRVQYLYETNAGAGLPIISTIQDLRDSGDKIQKIEAILSGTISYIFNNLANYDKFSEILYQAMKKGFTEPDPREDLNGMDFARKLLLLSREIGEKIEVEDVEIEHILPQEVMDVNSVDEFFIKLKEYDQIFLKLKQQKTMNGEKLSWIATYEEGKAIIKLKAITRNHPFYNLQGSDNIIAITTNRYPIPIVIKGAGAGAEVTAAGVLADIFKISNTVIMKRIY